MKRKNVILTMLVILGMVTFLDRINISVAGSSIMHDLQLSPSEWGWVQSAFILSYGLMQIPMGALGDRFGHRHDNLSIHHTCSLLFHLIYKRLTGGRFVIKSPLPSFRVMLKKKLPYVISYVSKLGTGVSKLET